MTAPASTSRLEFRDVSKRFAQPGAARFDASAPAAVEHVSLRVRDGEVVSLIGPSGCGKSTLLNMGAGLEPCTSGDVFVDDERVEGPNAHVAFMLQKDLLLPWRTIRQNVELGLEIRHERAQVRRDVALALLRRCRLAEFAEHYPHQLSGGMRQRVALARTLAVEPTVLLLDEPFSALDAQTKMVLQQDLGRTLAEAGKTALFITHDLAESVALSDRVLVMSPRPGRIVEEIRIDLPDRDQPLARRQLAGAERYVAELMDILHVGETIHEAAT